MVKPGLAVRSHAGRCFTGRSVWCGVRATVADDVVDTYSRCIMGMHVGFDAPSAAVVCLALRHAILPRQYSTAYELKQSSIH